MRTLFVDTLYWIATVNPHDHWRERALAVSRSIPGARLVTTREVVIEFLNSMASLGPHIRQRTAAFVDQMAVNPDMEIVPQSEAGFAAGFALYQDRLDKEYSLTDCISMVVMRERGIPEALTHDHHFTQEGFTVLL